MTKGRRNILTHFDATTILLILPLVILSGYLIGEINPTLAKKHTIYVLVGIGAFVVFVFIPIRKLSYLIPFAYWLNIGLLVAVEFFGHTRLGAKRWLEIPFVHFTLQPSEFIKPFFLLMLAYLISKNPPRFNGYSIKEFAKLSFYILLPFVLILKEPDLGTATILLLLGFGILFLVGVNPKIWLTLIVTISVSMPFIYHNLHDYQKKRLIDFISEKPSYHVQQSIIAIGSGGIYGKNKDDATQTQMKFLPIASSDFIFAYVVERFGFIGSLALISLYALLILHLLSIYGWTDDYYIKVMSGGIALLIFIYMSVNILMTIGFAPVVGVPLPMFSYGGSSFVNFMIVFGILENLLVFRFVHMYDNVNTKSFL